MTGKVPEPAKGLKRVIKAFGYSIQGLVHGIKNEAAIGQEFVLTCVAVPLVLLLELSLVFKAILIFGHLSILIVELLNSAVEAIVDKASPEYHPLAKQAKDMGSAAVLLIFIAVGACWVFALIEMFSRRL